MWVPNISFACEGLHNHPFTNTDQITNASWLFHVFASCEWVLLRDDLLPWCPQTTPFLLPFCWTCQTFLFQRPFSWKPVNILLFQRTCVQGTWLRKTVWGHSFSNCFVLLMCFISVCCVLLLIKSQPLQINGNKSWHPDGIGWGNSHWLAFALPHSC